jgi:signal transduction histidine kinase
MTPALAPKADHDPAAVDDDDDASLKRALLMALGRLDTGPEAALDGLTVAAAAATGCAVAVLRVDDGEHVWFLGSHGLFDDGTLAAETLRLVHGEGFVERRAPAADEPPDLAMSRSAFGHVAGEPLRVEGRVVGTLAVADGAPRAPLAALPRRALRGLADAAEALLASYRPGAQAHAHALHRRQALLARIGHEMRTPLNAVLGFTQLLQAEAPAEGPRAARTAAWLHEVERASQQLLDLVDEMLRLGRQET